MAIIDIITPNAKLNLRLVSTIKHYCEFCYSLKGFSLSEEIFNLTKHLEKCAC